MDDLEVAKRAALLGRETALGNLNKENRLNDESSPSTEGDFRAEEEIRALLGKHRPDDSILGEELGGESRGRTWVIDPIDGTINWMRDLPGWSSAVALVEDGVVRVSAIATAEGVFSAQSGIGSFGEKGESLKIEPGTFGIEKAVVATYLDGKRGQNEDFLKGVGNLVQKTATLRVIGAGSHDLLLVARGQIDAMVQYNLKPWDRAPGELIVLESGGIIRDEGPWFIAASSSRLADDIARALV